MKPPPDPHYRHRFPAEIISHAVWLYHVLDPVGRFQSLAPRDLRSIRMKIDIATPLCLMPTTGD